MTHHAQMRWANFRRMLLYLPTLMFAQTLISLRSVQP